MNFVTQDKNVLVTDSGIFECIGCEIEYHTHGKSVCLGKYESDEEASKEMINIINYVTQEGKTLYMPKSGCVK